MLVFTARQMKELEENACHQNFCSLNTMMENAGAATQRKVAQEREAKIADIFIVYPHRLMSKGGNFAV